MSRWLLLCVLLVLIEFGRPAVLQNALEKVLEDFHGQNLVQAAFRGQAAREAMEELQMGTYVQLEVDLVQTVCRKHLWRRQNCQIKPGGVGQHSPPSPSSAAKHPHLCFSPGRGDPEEARKRQEEACQIVKSANEEQYLPGKFAFSVGLPS
ncbi:PREDICTED: retinoic acid receptor responder protein 2 [Thamnophis sirtalis]|uniref:Retinoic acid receptor responder protein 2 n=1 Tax=Thamnophis sirtalis TaxID=35019 RepID=A0A6I9Y3T9_9SAUR|nr:PREDICTED: retinoic acid receptor responder protein 2 [Thamnophis sirtalis]